MPYIGKSPANVPVTADDIPNNSITAAKIVDNSITISDVGPNAVGTSEIVNDAVTTDKLNLISTSSVPSIEAKSDGTTDGYIQLNCTANSHGIKLKSPPHSAGASYTLTFPNDDGNANQKLTTNGSGVLTWTADVNTTYSVQDGELSQNNFTNADHTKLNAIEASATADQTNSEIKAAVEAASDSNTFTDADHSKLNAVAASANNYVHPNHSGEVTSTADGATVIADNIVDEANFKVSNNPTNGYFLSAQSGNTGGLTWATAGSTSASDLTSGTLPIARIADDAITVDKLANSINTAIAANTAKTGISSAQTSAITANTAKTGITSSQANAITANTAKTGISSAQTSAITANTAKTGITSSQATAITAALPKAGGTMTGSIIHNDNVKGLYGTGSDLEIYHTGSHAFIKNGGDGVLHIQGNNSSDLKVSPHDGENSVVLKANGAVELYHDNVKKIETTAAGVTVSGNSTVTGFVNATGSGTAGGIQFADGNAMIYRATNDMAFKLQGSEKMRITSAGKVGIGVTDPTQQLEVGHATGAHLTLRRVDSTIVSGDNLGQINFSGDDPSVTKGGAVIQAKASATWAANNYDSDLLFYLDDSAGNMTERMRLTSAGNVGIGLTAPVNRLHVGGADGESYIKFTSDATGHTSGDGARIGLNAQNLRIINAESAGHMLFLTANAERMRILNNGRIGLNHTTPEARLEIDGGSETGLMVRGTVAAETTAIFQGGGTGAVKVLDVRDSGGNSKFSVLQNGTATFVAGNGLATFIVAGGGQAGYYNTEYHNNANNGYTMGFKHGGTTVGTVITTSSATNYNTSSDYRLKENVDYTWDATTRLKQLKPARFNFIVDDTNTLVDGFIAHEVSSVVPEAIHGAKDAMTAEVLYVEGDELPEGKAVGDVKTASAPDYQGIDQSKLVPLLVKTIQELEARITALEA